MIMDMSTAVSRMSANGYYAMAKSGRRRPARVKKGGGHARTERGADKRPPRRKK
jgi:hypothetical protein